MSVPSTDGSQPIDVFEAMGTARSMRWFKPDPVPPALVDRVLWAATRASSANNTQPWDFVVVQDRDVRARIGALHERAMPAVARAGAPVPPGLDPTERRTREGAFNLMATMADVPVIVYVCGANTYPEAAPDLAFMYSAMFAAAQNLLVAARALGLGAAFTTLHRSIEPDLRTLLAIPDDRTIGVTLPLGWPARPFGPVTRRPTDEVVHHDRW